MMMNRLDDDRASIDALVCAFFRAFERKNGEAVRLEALCDVFLPEARIFRVSPQSYGAYDLTGFIEPRLALLNGDGLISFHEEELHGRTDVSGNIAQRLSTYRKRGLQNGEPFEGSGIKTFQFVRTPEGWRISALAWFDSES